MSLPPIVWKAIYGPGGFAVFNPTDVAVMWCSERSGAFPKDTLLLEDLGVAPLYHALVFNPVIHAVATATHPKLEACAYHMLRVLRPDGSLQHVPIPPEFLTVRVMVDSLLATSDATATPQDALVGLVLGQCYVPLNKIAQSLETVLQDWAATTDGSVCGRVGSGIVMRKQPRAATSFDPKEVGLQPKHATTDPSARAWTAPTSGLFQQAETSPELCELIAAARTNGQGVAYNADKTYTLLTKTPLSVSELPPHYTDFVHFVFALHNMATEIVIAWLGKPAMDGGFGMNYVDQHVLAAQLCVAVLKGINDNLADDDAVQAMYVELLSDPSSTQVTLEQLRDNWLRPTLLATLSFIGEMSSLPLSVFDTLQATVAYMMRSVPADADST